MSEETVDNTVDTTVDASVESQEPQQLSDREQVEQAAINRYRDSLKTEEERAEGVPEGYNEDGTPKEELIAGKFKSQEDLLAAYQELEKKLGQPKNESAADTQQEESSQETQDTEETQDSVGFSTEKYEQEVASNGSLSDASYAELEAKGFSRQQVDAYIQGQKAYADSIQNTVYSSVGGKEQYLEVINWASENMPADIISEYNSAVDSLDQDRVLRTLEYMKLKRDQASPREARRIEGESSDTGIQPFADKNEWQRAQTNRLYGKDAKYTAMVDKRYLAARRKGLL